MTRQATPHIIRPLNPAQRAAVRLMVVRGHVVIGMKPDQVMPIKRGDYVEGFAGHPLEPGYALVILGRTTRKDWEAQLTVLGKDPNIHPKARGQRYFACKLVTSLEAKKGSVQ